MSNRPTFFDFSVNNPEASRTFFETVFGWQFERGPGHGEYYRIRTGRQGTPGIDGAMGVAIDGKARTVNSIEVADLDATLLEILKHGGKVGEPRMALEGGGWVALFIAPGGLLIGLIQGDPKAS